MSPLAIDLEQSLQRHGAALRSLAFALLQNRADAEDAVQEVWLTALRSPPSDQRSIGGWLATSLHNIARKLRRTECRRARREDAVARDLVADDPAVSHVREESAQRLIAAVCALRQPWRHAIWQRYFEGMTPLAMARASGEPIATIRSRLQRGRQELRMRLGTEHSDWRGSLAFAFGLRDAATACPTLTTGGIAQGVLLMTTWTKIAAAVAIGAALLWLVRPMIAPTDQQASATERPLAEAAQAGQPQGSDATQASQRTAVAAPAEPVTSPFLEVVVRDEATGDPVPGASVLFVKPGFAYTELTPAQQDRYSRSTEGFLRDFGQCLVTDANGRTHIPIAAGSSAIVARKGDLFGTGWPRSSGDVQVITLSKHHTVLVETADAQGNPIPHVEVVVQKGNGIVLDWGIGTTDDNGRLTYVVPAPKPGELATEWLFAKLIDGLHGRETLERDAPPAFVRIVLPPLGSVHAKITGADGAPVDRTLLGYLHAELAVADAAPGNACYAEPDANGIATFTNIPLDKRLRLRFPGALTDPQEFPGPSAAERDVSIVRTLAAGHPLVVGTLVNADRAPVAGAMLAIFCHHGETLLASLGSTTAPDGRFCVLLSEQCLDRRDVVLTFGLDLVGTAFSRTARVAISGPLQGRVELGEVVMPDKD